LKTFYVELTKSYLVQVKAKNKEQATRVAELFTSDIMDISTPEARKNFSFKIEDISREVNEAFEVTEA